MKSMPTKNKQKGTRRAIAKRKEMKEKILASRKQNIIKDIIKDIQEIPIYMEDENDNHLGEVYMQRKIIALLKTKYKHLM